MQTFLPYPDFEQSAKCLDMRRLGKQRVEVLQLLTAMTTGPEKKVKLGNSEIVRVTPWYNHPACSSVLFERRVMRNYLKGTEMKLSNLLQSVTQNTASIDGVRWYPVRPKTAENTFLLPRIKAALRVLAGTSDAVEWDYPQDSKTPNAQVQAGQFPPVAH